MVVRKLKDVPSVSMPGSEGVSKQIVIGPDDGSHELVLRYFNLAPGGRSPRHTHDYPHLVKIETGHGVVVDAGGEEHPLHMGDYAYVGDNELHQFANTGSEPFAFICIVPRRGEA